MSFQKLTLFLVATFVFAASALAQTPTPTPADDEEKVATEEIKINVLAFDESGKFASGLTKDDLVISENGRLHQATSLRRIPANVLIVLDIGNEISTGTRRKKTSDAAINLVNSLQAEDSIAVMQYGDKVEILSEWTQDKAFLYKALDEKNLGIGKRSVFNQALDSAVKFFEKTPRENRHLILITNGIDSFNDQKIKDSALRNLLSSDINVHVISYTKLQQNAIEPKTSVWQKGEPNPKRLPEEVIIALPQQQQQILRMPRLGSINIDRAMIKKRKEEIAKLKTSEQFLTDVAEDTNGEIFLPEDLDEMVAKTGTLAVNIDSQYVATYTPKKPLTESADGEVRNIVVTSRRTDVQIQGRRKFVVSK
ncbi:MAG TPA: VWA domain-containing protein [Pyrinomonadaceae bacterium]|jgi:VWFA-related protein